MADMYNHINPDLNTHAPIIAKEIYEIVMANTEVKAKFCSIIFFNIILQRLNTAVKHDRDFDFNYFGFKVNIII